MAISALLFLSRLLFLMSVLLTPAPNSTAGPVNVVLIGAATAPAVAPKAKTVNNAFFMIGLLSE